MSCSTKSRLKSAGSLRLDLPSAAVAGEGEEAVRLVPCRSERRLKPCILRYGADDRAVEARVPRGIGSHGLHELRNLAVDLQSARGDLLKLVGAARKPVVGTDTLVVEPRRSIFGSLPDRSNHKFYVHSWHGSPLLGSPVAVNARSPQGRGTCGVDGSSASQATIIMPRMRHAGTLQIACDHLQTGSTLE